MTSPPGWYPDPRHRHEYRWWDGRAWTEHAASGGRALRDPLDAPPPPVTGAAGGAPGWAAGRAPAGASSGTSGVVNPKAIVSLVLGVAALPTLFLFGLGLIAAIAAIVLGIVARREIARNPDQTGAGAALGGIVIGAVVLLLTGMVVAGLLVWSRSVPHTVGHRIEISPFGAVLGGWW